MFQSLSRDSGRLNRSSVELVECLQKPVSIPQSGFGAFERGPWPTLRPARVRFQSLSRDSGRLNSASSSAESGTRRVTFQSLSRDSGRLNHLYPEFQRRWTNEFQSLSRDSGRLN